MIKTERFTTGFESLIIIKFQNGIHVEYGRKGVGK